MLINNPVPQLFPHSTFLEDLVPIIQVHDELVYLVPEEDIDEILHNFNSISNDSILH